MVNTMEIGREAVPNSHDTVHDIDAHWRAANYRLVGKANLLDNPLPHESMNLEYVKPRLLGAWGATPVRNFIYARLNRVIMVRDLDMLYVAGSGHGGLIWLQISGWMVVVVSFIPVSIRTPEVWNTCSESFPSMVFHGSSTD